MQDSYGLRREDRLWWVAVGDRPSTLCTDGLAPAGPSPALPWSPHFLRLCNTNTAGRVGEKHNPSTAQMPPVTRAPDIVLTY